MAHMYKHAGFDVRNQSTQVPSRKADISGIQSSALALNSNTNRLVGIKYYAKEERNKI